MRRRSKGQNEKVFRRELARLETSPRPPGPGRSSAFFITPPFYTGYCCAPILELLERYQVRACYYGHLHGGSHRLALQGRRGGVEYRLVSADYLKFRPEKILE